MIRSKGANYIGATERPKVRSLKTKLTTAVATLAAAMTVFVGLGIGALAVDAGTTQNITSAEAGLGLSCTSVIGGEMDRRSPWGGGPLSARLYEDLNGRTLTLNEIVGSPAWTNYTGIGPGKETDFFIKSYADVLDGEGLNGGALDDGTGEGSNASTAGILPQTYATNWGEVQGKLESQRTTDTCFFEQTFVTGIANGAGLGLANALQMFVTWVSTTAFNSSFICDPESPSTDGCIDLVKVIGGRDDAGFQSGGDGGIIGDLTNSIYKPLVLIVVIVTALGVAWTGIVKRQFREALTQTVWLVVSFVIGLALLLNPSMLAKAPMIATNAVTGCVIGAFNGVNCFDGSGFSSDTSGGVALTADSGVCISDATGASADQITALAVNSMGCTIWKTFILQNYAKGAFGVNLDQLEVNNADTVAGAAAAVAGVAPSNFCYTLQTTGSIAGYDGEWLQTKSGGSQICNLAVYNILMQMKVTPLGETAADVPLEYDPAWYDLVVTTASSEKMWPIWSNGGQQFLQGFVAVISVLLGGILIVVASVAALMYYITAIILLIFAPLFILVGINPGRGKKIMLGWLETILASILKYLASAIFLLIALALYSAVLGAADPMAALLFVAILSMVLWMYRKEIIDMFSKVSLGGERMANMMDKQVPILGASGKQLSDKAAKMPGAIAGGALGGLMAGGVGKMGDGMKIATQNELRSAPGLVGRAAQAKERQMRDNSADFGREASAAKEAANRASVASNSFDDDARTAQTGVRQAEDELANVRADARGSDLKVDRAEDELIQAEENRTLTAQAEVSAQKAFDDLDLRAGAHMDAVNTVADTGVQNGNISSAVAEFRKLSMSIDQLGANAKIADQQGNITLAATFRQDRDLAIERRADVELAGTDTPEAAKQWRAENKEFDRLLDREQKSRGGELMADDGTIKKYNPDEHVAAGQKVVETRQASMDADIKINVAASQADYAKKDAGIAQERVGLNEQIVQTREAEAADIRKRADQAKIDAAALTATSDVMFKQNQDLGPGNMPTVRDTKKMAKEAFESGEKIRESHETIAKVNNGEEIEARPATVGAAVRDVITTALPGKSVDERAKAATEQRVERSKATEEAREARNSSTTPLRESTAEEARLAERGLNAAKEQARLANLDRTQAEGYAKPHREEITKYEKEIDSYRSKINTYESQITQLSGLIDSGAPVPKGDGSFADPAELAKMKQDVETRLNAANESLVAKAQELTVKTQEAAPALSRADAAQIKADAAEAARKAAEEDRKLANERAKNAEAWDRTASRQESKAEKKEDKAVRREEKATVAQDKQKDVLTRADVEKMMVAKPSSVNESERNNALTKLIGLADSLSKKESTPGTTEANAVAALQAEIKALAKNVDDNPKASAGLIDSLTNAVSKLVPAKDKNEPAPSAPTRLREDPATGNPTASEGGLPRVLRTPTESKPRGE